jgi:nicotinamide riboside kinase
LALVARAVAWEDDGARHLPNKVVFPVFWRLVVLILFCDFR